jgi:predicted nucleotidyltransferase
LGQDLLHGLGVVELLDRLLGDEQKVMIDEDKIADFCRRHHIRWLAVFGSVLRDDFAPDTDIDVPVDLSRYFRDKVVAEAEVQYASG